MIPPVRQFSGTDDEGKVEAGAVAGQRGAVYHLAMSIVEFSLLHMKDTIGSSRRSGQ